jgi:hypothetical protein
MEELEKAVAGIALLIAGGGIIAGISIKYHLTRVRGACQGNILDSTVKKERYTSQSDSEETREY